MQTRVRLEHSVYKTMEISKFRTPIGNYGNLSVYKLIPISYNFGNTKHTLRKSLGLHSVHQIHVIFI